jgi:peptidyl-prolyl cis-trans isomerase C
LTFDLGHAGSRGYNHFAMKARFAAAALLLILLLTGCGRYLPIALQPTATQTASPAPPTGTPVPLAALVNGEPIPLQTFEDEVQRFEAAQVASGIDLATLDGYREQVLAALIDLKLLTQGAVSLGLTVSGDEIQQRLADLMANFGDTLEFERWLGDAGYTPETFPSVLEEQVLAERMIEAISLELPGQVEQVHARHILVATNAEAEEMLGLLASGSDFATLASQFSLDASTRPAGGDLGWFPQGFLVVPEVDEAAFSLEPGTISGVVESDLGYHLVQTLERGLHAPDANAQRWLQEQAVEKWLAEQRGVSEIELFITP